MPLRRIEPEWLDELPANAPEAIRSRRDLRWLNVMMGHAGLMVGLLRRHRNMEAIQTLVELGAGDGTFLLKLAKRMQTIDKPIKVVLVDRQPCISQDTRKEFQGLGWELEVVTADILEALRQFGRQSGVAMLANLFLHHFEAKTLTTLLREVASRADFFAACEPRRSIMALNASKLVGLIGCNAVTRHDAVASVRAGFAGRELSDLWPAKPGWLIEEGTGGLFSHVFVARRSSIPE